MNGRAMLWVTLAAAMLILIVVAPVVSAGDKVTWYWKDTNASGFTYPGGHQFDKFMNKSAEPTGDEDVFISIDPNGEVWWYADQPAQCDLEFPPGDWRVHYSVEAEEDPGKKTMTVGVYILRNDGTTDKLGTRTRPIGKSDGLRRWSSTIKTSKTTSLSVGDRMAVRFRWVNGAKEALTIHYDSESYPSKLVSPPYSPPYPVPEPSILTLISIGLILFVCISGFKRLNDRK